MGILPFRKTLRTSLNYAIVSAKEVKAVFLSSIVSRLRPEDVRAKVKKSRNAFKKSLSESYVMLFKVIKDIRLCIGNRNQNNINSVYLQTVNSTFSEIEHYMREAVRFDMRASEQVKMGRYKEAADDYDDIVNKFLLPSIKLIDEKILPVLTKDDKILRQEITTIEEYRKEVA